MAEIYKSDMKKSGMPPRQIEYSLPVSSGGKSFSSIGLYSFDSNLSAYFSSIELLGKFSDYLGVNQKWDKKVVGRLFLAFFGTYTNWVASFSSHENAHTHIDRMLGLPYSYEVDWSDWSKSVPNVMFPRDDAYFPGSLIHRYSMMHGLVQQEMNAQHLHSTGIARDVFTFDEGLAYLFNTLHDFSYILYEKTFDVPSLPKKGTPEYYVKGFIPLADISGHTYYVNNFAEGSLTDNRWLVVTSLTTFLSAHFWESLVVVGKYLASGDRVSRPVSLGLGDISLYPPHFQTLTHPDGLFVEGNFPVKNLIGRDEVLCFGYGRTYGADEVGDRFEIQLSGLRLFALRNVSLALDLDAAFSRRAKLGYSLSTGLNLKINNFGFDMMFRRSDNDIFHNEILGKGVEKPPFENYNVSSNELLFRASIDL